MGAATAGDAALGRLGSDSRQAAGHDGGQGALVGLCGGREKKTRELSSAAHSSPRKKKERKTTHPQQAAQARHLGPQDGQAIRAFRALAREQGPPGRWGRRRGRHFLCKGKLRPCEKANRVYVFFIYNFSLSPPPPATAHARPHRLRPVPQAGSR
jgi:hypothetical protein